MRSEPKLPVHRLHGLLAVAAMCGLVLCQCGQERLTPVEQAPAFDCEPYLPDSGDLGEWRPEGRPQVFEGEDLFAFINGGADIFHEYGFERVIVQDYSRTGGGKITLEIYMMTNDTAAFGIWTMRRGSKGRVLSVGGGGLLADYYATFWKGPLMITLTSIEQGADAEEDLEVLARAVDGAIGSETAGIGNLEHAEPDIVDLLPVDGLEERSVVYMTGPLALFNCHRFSIAVDFGAEEMVKGDYVSGCRVLLLAFGSDQDAEGRFETIASAFAAGEDYLSCERTGKSFRMLDSEGRIVIGTLLGRFLSLLVAAPDAEDHSSLKTNIEKRLEDVD